VRSAVVLLSLVVLLGGCRSVPTAPAITTTVDRRVAATETAALRALATAGFNVVASRPGYVEGYRPRRWGFMSGSGGETVAIWLAPETDDRTRIGVETGRTFMGGSGQRDWTSDIMRRILKELDSLE
jgi:hypothetical protein